MYTFINRGGTHSIGSGKKRKDVPYGGTFQSPKRLDKTFPNHFELVQQPVITHAPGTPLVPPPATAPSKPAVAPAAAEASTQTGQAPAADSAAPAPGPAAETSAFGSEVTVNFTEAFERDLLVYQKGGWYTIVAKENPTVPLNETKLKKDAVAAFIEALPQE